MRYNLENRFTSSDIPENDLPIKCPCQRNRGITSETNRGHRLSMAIKGTEYFRGLNIVEVAHTVIATTQEVSPILGGVH